MKISGMDAVVSNVQSKSEPHISEIGTGVALPKITTQEKPQKQIDTQANPITEKMLTDAVGRMNRLLEGTNRRFEYSVHDKINGIMVKVIDEDTGEIIREIPPKRILDMVANMLELAGLLVDERR
jgi:flagellar protein FlaG